MTRGDNYTRDIINKGCKGAKNVALDRLQDPSFQPKDENWKVGHRHVQPQV